MAQTGESHRRFPPDPRPGLRGGLPGCLGFGMMVLLTTLWTFWGVAELFHEGWHYGWGFRLFYLAPGALCLALTLVALLWPRLGGWLLIGTGGLLGGLFAAHYVSRFGLSFRLLGSALLPILGLAFIGGLFLLEHRWRREAAPWWRFAVAVAVPLAVGAAIVAVNLPLALHRLDDGDYTARLIQGEGVTLVWAPLGPGWVVGHGVPWYESLAVCRHLSADGERLMERPQDVWRVPTTDELVRSLVRGGESAGCTWDGTLGPVTCRTRPNKETPLWIPSAEVIYYWSADEADGTHAYYVAYNGTVGVAEKDSSADYRGFRCVREP